MRARCLVPSPVFGGVSSPLKYSPPGAFSLATFALDDSAWLWPNARRDRNRFSSLPKNTRHRPAIRSTRSSINSLMRIALTHRYRRTPHANIVTTRVRGMMRASVRQPDGVSATIELTGTSMRTVQSLSSVWLLAYTMLSPLPSCASASIHPLTDHTLREQGRCSGGDRRTRSRGGGSGG